MRSGIALAATLFAVTSLSMSGQQTAPTQPGSPATQQSPPGAASAQQDSQAAATTAAPDLSPVKCELVSKLDSKTAKAGDNVEIRTKASAKTADGTEIPQGAKLVGHVTGVKPSQDGTTSQVALQIDHMELNGGQSVPVHSQIQSIAPPEGAASSSGADGMSAASNRGAGAASGSDPQSGAATAGGEGPPPPGTVIAKSGLIDIQTTSIPGVLLANNAPGQQDPRMTTTSSILLGAKRDVQLDRGTQMTVGVAKAGAGAGQ